MKFSQIKENILFQIIVCIILALLIISYQIYNCQNSIFDININHKIESINII